MIVAIVIVSAMIIGTVTLLLPPLIKLQRRRRAARDHTPQPQEIWARDSSGVLYIKQVNDVGLELLSIDATTRDIQCWGESWPQWEQRLRTRVVLFSGQRRPLQTGLTQFMQKEKLL